MWNKFLDKLDVLLEPQFDDIKFVSQDSAFLVYKKMNKPIHYFFTIEEETLIDGVKTRNIYKQVISVNFVSKDYNNIFQFDINVLDSEYELDKRLAKQELLIKQLAEITNKVSFEVNSNGYLQKVINYKEIQKKWEGLKPKFKDRHIGKLSHAYIDAIGEKINNQTAFTADFSQYRLFGFIFNGLLNLSLDKSRPNKRKRTFKNYIHYLPLRVNERIQFLEEDKEAQELSFKINGDLLSLQDDENKKLLGYFDYYRFEDKTLSLNTYDGLYIIDKHTATIKNGWLKIQLTNNKEYTRNMNISLKQIDYGR